METYIRYPLNKRLVFGMSMLLLISIYTISGTNDRSNRLLYVVLGIISLVIISAACWN